MLNALIIGGGPAGTTTAMALQRVGIDAVVYEAYPRTTAQVGSYFTVAINGLDALSAIGAHHIAVDIGFPCRKNVLWNDRGHELGTIRLDKPLSDGTVSQTIKRARLSNALQDEAIRRGVPVEFGKRLAGAQIGADGRVEARFEDGTRASGDVLIGADGLRSVTRGIIDPGAPSPRYVGLTNFGGLTRAAGLQVEPEAWHLIFGRRAFFGYSVDQAGDVVWFANVPRNQISAEERASTSADAWRQQLIELFGEDRGPAVELIRRGNLELAGDNTFDLPHVPTWHKGPLILIGDAAHAPSPSSGQGASIALEDAVALARSLRDSASVPEAFAAYEQLRRQRVERIVAQGARSSSNKTPGSVGRLLRDVMLRVMFKYFVTEKSFAWIGDYHLELDPALEVTARA